jgi:hypothetical protein
MGIKRKYRFVLVDRRSSILATIISNPNLTTSVDAARKIATTLKATQPLVRYFDPYGGFSRIGRVIASHAMTRGRRKGTVVLTIATMPNGQVIRNSDQVELVK